MIKAADENTCTYNEISLKDVFHMKVIPKSQELGTAAAGMSSNLIWFNYLSFHTNANLVL